MKHVLLAVAIAVTGCASKQPRSYPRIATQQELDEKYEAYFKCMVGRAYSSDDLQSDAGTIARAIQNACVPEWGDYFSHFMMGKSLPNDARERVSAKGRGDAALNAVLTSRKLRQEADKTRPTSKTI